jgi:putative ABC transport system permease protein
VSTLDRKAWGDLIRHRSRTLLAAFTLSIAIASIGFIAVPGLLNTAMNRQVQANRLEDIGVSTRVLDLTPAQLHALGHLRGVAAVTASSTYTTEATYRGSTQTIEVTGGSDLTSAAVDSAQLLTGRPPGPDEVLADATNGRAADLAIPAGGTIRVRAAHGARIPLRVSGTAIDLAVSPGPSGSTTAVFYASRATMQTLTGSPGVNYLAFRLTVNSTAAQNRVISAVRAYLTAHTGPNPFTGLPVTTQTGQWPGKPLFGHLMALLYIITFLAFLSALFLISATMNTLIAEQAMEIAILKAIGGRRRQIAGIILRTAVILGAAAAVLGAVLGIVLAYLVAHYFGLSLFAISVGFGVSPLVVVASLVLGPVLAIVASLPALRRALRRPVAETLADQGASGYGTWWLDRLAARRRSRSGSVLSGSTRMGVRNALRQKRRSVSTIAQVAVAAGLAIAFLALGRSADVAISQAEARLRFGVWMEATTSAQPFTSRATAIATAAPGITGGQLVETGYVRYNGQVSPAFGLGPHPYYEYRLSSGRWFTAADAADADAAHPAVVLGPAVARAAHARTGQLIPLTTAAGAIKARVVGVDTGEVYGGLDVYFPLPVLERLDGTPGAANGLWLRTRSPGHAAIGHALTTAAARLTAAGYPSAGQEVYVLEADSTDTIGEVFTIISVLGLLVVAITLMGLVSALSMGVIERTREVGILRCLGARARHIRRVFSAEAVTLAAVGWVLGVPLGWLIYQGLLSLILHDVGISLPAQFPAFVPLVTLAGVLVLTLAVIRVPLRRATRIRPGNALRYQ